MQSSSVGGLAAREMRERCQAGTAGGRPVRLLCRVGRGNRRAHFLSLPSPTLTEETGKRGGEKGNHARLGTWKLLENFLTTRKRGEPYAPSRGARISGQRSRSDPHGGPPGRYPDSTHLFRTLQSYVSTPTLTVPAMRQKPDAGGYRGRPSAR